MATHPPGHDATLEIVNWANARDAVRAVLLTSTRAIIGSQVDALSDYDVILIVADIHPFVDDHHWLDDFGAVLVAYWDPIHPDPVFGIDSSANVTQYCDGLKIDFNLWSVDLLQRIIAAHDLPAELDAGYRMLLDKDHLTDAMHPATGKAYVPCPPTEQVYQVLINDFLSDAPYVAKCLWRDELMPAKWCLDYDMKYAYLRQMLEWRVEIGHHWSVPVGFLGKGLKKRLPPETWSALEETYVGARTADNWQALINTLLLFRRVSMEVGDHFGYTYPDDLHQQVCDYVEHIRQMGAPSNHVLG